MYNELFQTKKQEDEALERMDEFGWNNIRAISDRYRAASDHERERLRRFFRREFITYRDWKI